MKITRISVSRIVLPLKYGGYTWAKGKTLAETDTTVAVPGTTASAFTVP